MLNRIKSVVITAVVATLVTGPAFHYLHKQNQELTEIISIQNRAMDKMSEGMMNLATATFFLAGAVQGVEERMDEVEKKVKKK